MAPVDPPPIPHAPPGAWGATGPQAPPPPQVPPPPPPLGHRPPRPARTWVAVTSLSVAVLALALAFVPWVKVLAVLLALAALVGGVLVLVRRWRGRAMAVTAISVATVAALVATVLLVVGAVSLLRSGDDEVTASGPASPAPSPARPSPRSPSPPTPSPSTPGPSAPERDPFTDPAPEDLYGEAVAPGRSARIEDYDVTVSGVRPASGQLEGGDQVEYVAFDLTVVNTSDGVRDVAGDLGITVVDQDLERYVEQRCADLLPPRTPDEGQPPASAVPPGATVSGTVCEDVPAAVVPGSVLLISVEDAGRVSGSTWALGAGSDPAP